LIDIIYRQGRCPNYQIREGNSFPSDYEVLVCPEEVNSALSRVAWSYSGY